jgi:hypothetical protein
MSLIGYYRYKTTADSEKVVNFVVNDTNVATKNIVPVDTCEGDLIIKYLDKNGQYRFYPFNKYYRTSDAPELIGTANKFITNILSDQSDKQNVGFRNKRKIQMSADVPTEELEKLVDIYTSPRVYLYIGSGSTDSAEDWLEVNQIVENPVVRRNKKNTGRIDITIELPENYSITMI